MTKGDREKLYIFIKVHKVAEDAHNVVLDNKIHVEVKFRNKYKGWHYIGQDPEPLDKSIFDYVNFNSTKVNISSPKIHPEVTQSNMDVNRSNSEITSYSLPVHTE